MIRWEVDIRVLRVRWDSFELETVNKWLSSPDGEGWEPLSFCVDPDDSSEVILKCKRIKAND
jgi:hypothetical protein